ncbi:MAG: MBL fold metallo-hydrolase, partial [Lachnospiraceae bacterium]|nr:MBL fold metallo-hydrolase [Lachnospiraceae bacterium]
MRLCSIASGSSGNCIYVGSDTTHLLVDVGISGKRTEEGLKELDLSMRDIDGIFITHEHADHIAGLWVLSRNYEIPIYATAGTSEAIKQTASVGEI